MLLNPPKCSHPLCDNVVTQITSNNVWFSHCSRKCRGKHNSLKSRETAKKTCIEKYGVEHTNNIESKKEKSRKTCMERYGVDNPTKSTAILAKRETTYLERYGVCTNLLSDETREKSKKTCLEKYGVTHQSKNKEIRHRQQTAGFNRKEYRLPSGKIILIQGFEDRALDELLRIYREDEITTDLMSIPCIQYIGVDGKEHNYYPDFFIPLENLIIEVKSEWTYSGKEIWIKTNLLKEKACINAGFNFRFMIMQR